MRGIRLSRNRKILLALLAALMLFNAWYAFDTWRVRDDMQRLEEDLATDRQNLRRLQSLGQLTAAQQELATLVAKAPASLRQPLPTSADTLKIVSDLISGQTAAGKMVSLRAKDPKTETVDGITVLVVGYEVSMLGSSQDELTLLKRVDGSELPSLKIPTFTMEKQNNDWLLKADLALSLLVPTQPAAGKTQ